MNIAKIYNVENRTGVSIPAMDINNGTLTLNGVRHSVIAVLCDCLLSDADIDKLKKCRAVVHVGTANYRYAPEIVHSVVYIKA